MNLSPVMRRLLWKEFQQLTPLLGVLLAMGLGLHLVLLFIPGWAGLPERFAVVVYGLPSLFAVGTGALLIGQEKELGTLCWLQSLPIAPRDIVRVKLYAALLGLAVAWSGSLLLGLLVAAIDPSTTWYQLSVGQQRWMIPAHALCLLFLVFTGIAISWRMRSATFSLLALVPVSLLPFLAANLIAWLADITGTWLPPSAEKWLSGGCLLLATLLALRVGWKTGLRALSPRPVHAQWWIRNARLARPTHSAIRKIPAAPTIALVWQFARQHRNILIGTTCILIVSGITLGCAELVPKGFIATAIFTTVLTWSWLGLLVFQGDTAEDRCLFLATRGVSPWQVWFTRQLIPCSIVTSSLVLLYFGLRQADLPVNTNVSTTGILAVLVFFLASQWFGQCVRSAIVGAILAPLVGFGAIAWLASASSELAAPTWSLLIAGSVPLLATRLMTRRWMDNQRSWRYWFLHSGLLMLFLLIPTIPFLLFVARYPRAPEPLMLQLGQIAHDHANSELKVVVLTRNHSQSNGRQPVASRSERLGAIRERLHSNQRAVPDLWSLKFVIADLEVRRLELGTDTRAEAKSHYRDSLRLLLTLRDRLRNSHRLLDQDRADAVDVWLLAMAQTGNATDQLGPQLRDQLIQKVADRDHRYRMRQRAIALSWRAANDDNLGGYVLTTDPIAAATLQSRFTQVRNNDLLCALLLKKLTAASADQTRLNQRIRELIEAVPGTIPARQEISAPPAPSSALLLDELLHQSVPGRRWHGDWEQAADDLASSLSHSANLSQP